MTNLETRVDATGRSSSQEQIVSVTTGSGDETINGSDGNSAANSKMGISKTVEFIFHESELPPV
jgi:hypothetical protein